MNIDGIFGHGPPGPVGRMGETGPRGPNGVSGEIVIYQMLLCDVVS